MRRTSGAVAVALVLIMLAGCVRIPTTGPVRSVPLHTRSAEAPVDVEPQAPGPGASADDVVYGFLQAMAHSRGDYTVARAFLTDQAALDWQPGQQVLIYSEDGAPRLSDQHATISTHLVGRLDARGTYEPVAEEPYSHDFGLVREAGEWRISHPPEGLLLGSYLFQSAFAPVTIYFWDRGMRSLVPDVFYLPRGKRSATVLMQTMLAGPSVWLASATSSAIPDGTRLAAGSVDVSGAGVADVSLSRQVASLSPEARARVVRQIAVTLLANPLQQQPARLRVLQESTPLDVPEAAGDGSVALTAYDDDLPTALQATTDLYGIHRQRLVRVLDTPDGTPRVDPLPGDLGTAQPGLRELDVNASATRVAYTVDDAALYEASLTSSQRPQQPAYRGSGVRSPAYSRFDELWFLADVGGAQALFRRHSGQIEQVAAPALNGIRVSSIEVGPDGVRTLVEGERDGRPVVGLALIQRGDTLRLDGFREISFAEGSRGPETIVSAGWRSDRVLLVLGRPPQSSIVLPYQADIDALRTVAGYAATDWTATKIVSTAYSDHPQAMALGANGRVWQRVDDTRWRPYLEGMTALAYPG